MENKQTKKGSQTVEKRESHRNETGDSRFLVSMQQGCTPLYIYTKALRDKTDGACNSINKKR